MRRHVGGAPAAGHPHRPAQKLHPVSRPLGHLHIPQRDPGDALYRHTVRVHLVAEGQVRQNADLPSGVKALHVGGGVRLGIALGLRLPQGVGEKGPGAHHAGENIVGGAV